MTTNTQAGDKALQAEVSSILHRMRTRALRDAPIHLGHINEVEIDVLQLIKSKQLEARIDMLDGMWFCERSAAWTRADGKRMYGWLIDTDDGWMTFDEYKAKLQPGKGDA